MIKLKILRWEDHAGLYRWALTQLHVSLLEGGRGKVHRQKGRQYG